MKRATLLLEDQLYLRVKELSHRRGSSLKEVINDLLRLALNTVALPKRTSGFKIPLHRGAKPNPAFDPSDRNTWDILDEN